MPYKHNLNKRHKFAKAKYKVTNWKEYTKALKKRGDIEIWVSDEAINEWHPKHTVKKRGRPLLYSDVAIQTMLAVRQVYHLPLRQTEGFVSSLIRLLKLDITAPDYTLISKRSIGLKLERLIDSITPGSCLLIDSTGLKVYGKDEWHQEKHNVKAKRTWRKLHLAVDENHQIVACDLTDNTVGDPTALESLLSQVDEFETFIGDGAYDGSGTYEAINNKQADARIVVPPPKNAVLGASSAALRNEHAAYIDKHGRMAWQIKEGYGLRAHAELAMLRYKTIIGNTLKARMIPQQKTEAAISARVLNKMTQIGMPTSIKIS